MSRAFRFLLFAQIRCMYFIYLILYLLYTYVQQQQSQPQQQSSCNNNNNVRQRRLSQSGALGAQILLCSQKAAASRGRPFLPYSPRPSAARRPPRACARPALSAVSHLPKPGLIVAPVPPRPGASDSPESRVRGGGEAGANNATDQPEALCLQTARCRPPHRAHEEGMAKPIR